MDERTKKILIFCLGLILAFCINFWLFKLDFSLSLIYDIILFSLVYCHISVNDEDTYGNIKEKIAIALISESIIISFQVFYYTKTNWIFFTRNIKVTIAPNMLTLIVSMLYALSIYLRNRISISNKLKDICINILNILFFSSLISALISNDYFYIPIYGETSFSSQSFCIFLLVLSWIGMKSLNIFIFPLLAIFSLGRIGEVNKAMGITGLFYLLFAYTSLILQISGNEKIIEQYKMSLVELSNDFKFQQNSGGVDDSSYQFFKEKNK